MRTNNRFLPGTLLVTLIITSMCGCNEMPSDKPAPTASASEATSVTNYPYTIEHPDNWEIGSTANTLVALNGLKAWEEGKMDESLKYFGDSVRVQFDGFDKKMPNDSLKAMFTSGWNNYKTVQVKMDDFESVISKDKTEEWVTLWYRQTWETKEGVKDSSSIINDIQLKDGKIIRLSEHTRKLH